MGGLTSQGETQLESTYSITMLLQAFEKRLKLYDMQHVFTIIVPDDTSTTGGIETKKNDLLRKYADTGTTLDQVQNLVEHYRSWGQSYDLEDLDWTCQLLENSCSNELKDKVNKEMLEVDPIHQGALHSSKQ